MGWIARILGAVPKEQMGGLRIDLKSDFWEVEGKTTFPALFRAIDVAFPHNVILYFEGGSPNQEIRDFMREHAIPETVHVAYGTIWPKPEVFHVPVTSDNINMLSDIAQRCAWPELAAHFHVYRDNEILLEWHDAFTEPMLLAGNLPEDIVRQFAEGLGMTYKKGKSSNQAL